MPAIPMPRVRGIHALILATVLLLCAGISRAEKSFIDDAKRTVTLPTIVQNVFAAGAPAEILLYTLVPEMLVGRNHMPPPAALEFIPPELRSPKQITNLPDRDDARFDAELLESKADVYVDYGTIDGDYVAALEAISARTHVAAIILDGQLTNVPMVYRKLGAAFGVPDRGERLAVEADRIIAKYRGSLAATKVRVYLACSQNGTMPCVEGHAFGEAAALLGAINVAGTTQSAPRRAFTIGEIRAGAPDVVIAASKSSVATLRGDARWREVAAVAAGRVYVPPELPFNWGPRPPSVNRLLGVIWMAYVLPRREFDDAFFADVTQFFTVFYHMTPTREELQKLVAME